MAQETYTPKCGRFGSSKEDVGTWNHVQYVTKTVHHLLNNRARSSPIRRWQITRSRNG